MAAPKNTERTHSPDDLFIHGRRMPEGKQCDWPGCDDLGEHRAPKSRNDIQSFFWFCRIHAREYNAKWNYYEGMSDEEVDADVRRDTTWQRPSWPLGNSANPAINDPLNIFECAGIKEKEASRSPFPPGSKESDALAELDLNWPVTQESVKACYKKLVKRHHPDANNGCKEAEERFKRIKNAYEILMPRLVELELNV